MESEYAPIRPTYILTDGNLTHVNDKPIEHKTESAALKAAKTRVEIDPENEVWVWRLSHVVGMPVPRPTLEPEVTKVTA